MERSLEDMDAKTFGEQVRHYRIVRGWDQSDLATRIQKSIPTVSRIENGTQTVTLEVISALARALEVSPSTLFGERDTSALMVKHSAAHCAKKGREVLTELDALVSTLEVFATS